MNENRSARKNAPILEMNRLLRQSLPGVRRGHSFLAALILVVSGTSALTAQTHSTNGSSQSGVSNSRISVPVSDFAAFEPLLHATGDTVYVINFWATWCAPCVKELPYFEEARKSFRGKPVRFILVSLDFRKQIESRLLPFLKKNDIGSEVLVLHDPDADAWIDRVDPSWEGALPATLVYRGTRRTFHEDTFTRDELFTLVQSFLDTSP